MLENELNFLDELTVTLRDSVEIAVMKITEYYTPVMKADDNSLTPRGSKKAKRKNSWMKSLQSDDEWSDVLLNLNKVDSSTFSKDKRIQIHFSGPEETPYA